MMNAAQFLTLTSAVFGAVGSALIFFGSHAFEPLAGSVWGGPIVDEANARTTERNRLRLLKQRAGLICLMMAFVLQGFLAFVIE